MVLHFHTVNDIFKAFSLTTFPACEQGKGEPGSKAIEKVKIQQQTYIPTCPRETLWKFLLSMVKPSFLPRASTSLRGSTPGLSTKNTGVAGPVSLKETSKGMVRFSTYLAPSFSSTYNLYTQNSYFERSKYIRYVCKSSTFLH